VKRVEIEIEGVAAEAEWNEAGAPRDRRLVGRATDRAAARALHMVGPSLRADASLSAVRELEHPVCSIYPGTLVARPGRGEVLISYGAAEYRSVLGVEYGTRIDRVV